ncbi:MAG: hypothetical protein M1828_004634 [Chrysothrix sp. TS-e1954]|nr:MAG: hypothetical protein M1828_004634 [Chrysothrix sp. TS-e1954]
MDDGGPNSQNQRVEALWKSLDTKRRGQLDIHDLKQGLAKLDHPLKNAEDLLHDVLKAIDLDDDGRITYNEFHSFVRHAESELWLLFKTIDEDHNNRLSKSELRDAFRRTGIDLPQSKLDAFFARIDANNDGVISFEEWRDFLLFVPADVPGLKAILSYYTASVKVNPEGDVQVSDETVEGLAPRIRHRPPDPSAPEVTSFVIDQPTEPDVHVDENLPPSSSRSQWSEWKPMLTALLPNPGYFLAGGIAGIVSRTSTAPLDRLKVYLIAQTNPASSALEAAKKGSPVEATKHAARPLLDAVKALWAAGGVRNFFAGNGLNVLKVMPESAIKFGSYEASKRIVAKLEGHGDPRHIHPLSQFVAGGMGGMISQFCVYPLDTLKFRMQCESVQGGLHGNKLIAATAVKMWQANGMRTFYRGLSMGLVGMFPYSAIDLGTFEALKRWIVKRNMRRRGCSEQAAAPGSVATAAIGGFSGALGASLVYPLNLLRTRLQTQGTAQHQRTYTGIVDVTRQTIKGEGVHGLFKGLTPNLLKVVPAVSITYVVYENSKRVLGLH